MLIDIAKEIGAERYNGGWTKTVTGLDKTKRNGYSIKGDFIAKSGLQNLEAGLYLDCDVAGSRKNNVNHYTLLKLNIDGSIDILQKETGFSGYSKGQTGRDWALKMWETIDKYYDEFNNNNSTELTVTIAKIGELLASSKATEKAKNLYSELLNELANGGFYL